MFYIEYNYKDANNVVILSYLQHKSDLISTEPVSDQWCGITTFNPTTRNKRGLELRERSLFGCPSEIITVRKGLYKEGRHTWPVTLSRSEVPKPNGRSRVRSLRIKCKQERDSN